MDKCSTSPVPIQKEDKFSLMQCPKKDLEQKQMEKILIWDKESHAYV